MKFSLKIISILAVTALMSATGAGAATKAGHPASLPATKIMAPSSQTAAFVGPRAQPFTGGARLHRRSAIHRNLDGPGCTVVNPSSALISELGYTSPPYSAGLAVTANGTTVNATNVNGTGCDFGIYVASNVSNVMITGNVVHDGFFAGIMVDTGATNVNVQGNQVSQTGWHDAFGYDPNGDQLGLGIYYLTSAGDISNNFVTQYQKNGITANSGANVSLENNVVIGLGSKPDPTQFIAQNGIQIYFSNFTALPTTNFVAFNWYGGGTYTATGYLICGATLNNGLMTKAQFEGSGPTKNVALHNQFNLYFSNNPKAGC